MNLQMKQVEFGSEEYAEAVALRDKILRKPLGMKFTEEQLQKEKNDHHLVIQKGDEIIATLVLTPEKDIMKMRQVAVDEEYQGMGIGKHLVAYSERFSKQKGFNKIYCHARDKAVKFYKSCGYHKEGEPFTEIGIQHFKMMKEL